MSRVHSSLAIAPSAPKVCCTSNCVSLADMCWQVDLNDLKVTSNVSVTEINTTAGFSETNPVAISEKIEATPSQMKTIVPDLVDDTIVVVGKTKQKKRKRTKTQEQSDEEPKEEAKELEASAKKKKSRKTTETTQDELESPEPFDYASAPNFLDEPVRVQSDIKKSQAKSKGKKGEYETFCFNPIRPSFPQALYCTNFRSYRENHRIWEFSCSAKSL